jgi:hypothetical protein
LNQALASKMVRNGEVAARIAELAGAIPDRVIEKAAIAMAGRRSNRPRPRREADSGALLAW